MSCHRAGQLFRQKSFFFSRFFLFCALWWGCVILSLSQSVFIRIDVLCAQCTFLLMLGPSSSTVFLTFVWNKSCVHSKSLHHFMFILLFSLYLHYFLLRAFHVFSASSAPLRLIFSAIERSFYCLHFPLIFTLFWCFIQKLQLSKLYLFYFLLLSLPSPSALFLKELCSFLAPF